MVTVDKLKSLLQIIEKEYPDVYNWDTIDELQLSLDEAEDREQLKRSDFKMETPEGNKSVLSLALAIFDYAQDTGLVYWEVDELIGELFNV